MKNVKIELSAIELIEIKHALERRANQLFKDNEGGERCETSFNYSIHSIEQIMKLYDKICKYYEQTMEE